MKLPSSMATQHPDSASRYVPIQHEVEEAVDALTPQPEGLGIEELMIDFEGKMTPYHQTAEIAHQLIAKGLIPGKDVALTPRISNATEETVFRQLMALMSIVEADYDIVKASPGVGGIEEVILPMVKGADDLIKLRRRIADIIELAHKEFGLIRDPNALQVIALIEGIPAMLNFTSLYGDYLNQAAPLGFTQKRLRYMIGKSDSALSYGMTASVLAVKIMNSQAYKLGENRGLKVAPILGGGSLPFRGHITFDNLDNILRDYAGVRTITIQSGIRYDQDSQVAKNLITSLKVELKKTKPKIYNDGDKAFIKDCLVIFALAYAKIFNRVAEQVIGLADVIPKQRDRLTSRGPSGYARPGIDPAELIPFTDITVLHDELKKIKASELTALPRAITFTAALYSVGLPPEFLGTGAAVAKLIELKGREGLYRLLHFYPGLKDALGFAGRFLHLEVAAKFFTAEVIDSVRTGLALLEKHLDIRLLDRGDKSYQTLLEIIEPLVRQVAHGSSLGEEDLALLRSCMIRLGKLRGSLG